MRGVERARKKLIYVELENKIRRFCFKLETKTKTKHPPQFKLATNESLLHLANILVLYNFS